MECRTGHDCSQTVGNFSGLDLGDVLLDILCGLKAQRPPQGLGDMILLGIHLRSLAQNSMQDEQGEFLQLKVLYLLGQLLRDMLLTHQGLEGGLKIYRADHHLGIEFAAGGSLHPQGLTILDENALDRSRVPDPAVVAQLLGPQGLGQLMASPFHDSAGSGCAHHQLEETPRSCVVMQYSPGDHKVGKQEGLSHGMFKLSLNSLQRSRLRARIKVFIAHSILSWIEKVGLVMRIQCRIKGLRVSSPGFGILFGPAGNLRFRLLQIGKQGQAFPIPLQ